MKLQSNSCEELRDSFTGHSDGTVFSCPLRQFANCFAMSATKDCLRGLAGLYCGTFSVSRCLVLSNHLPEFCVQQEGTGLTGLYFVSPSQFYAMSRCAPVRNCL